MRRSSGFRGAATTSSVVWPACRCGSVSGPSRGEAPGASIVADRGAHMAVGSASRGAGGCGRAGGLRGRGEPVEGGDAGEVVWLEAGHEAAVVLRQGLEVERAVEGDDAGVAPRAL